MNDRRSALRFRPSWGAGVLAGGVVAIVLGLSIMAYGVAGRGARTDPRRSPDQRKQHPAQASRHPANTCEPTAVTDRSTARSKRVTGGDRGRCLRDSTPSSAASCSTGHRADRVDALEGVGCARALVSHVENVSVVSCEPGAIDVSATLSILESRTCVEATCDQHGAPNSATLTLRVDPVSRKVVAATAPPSPDSEQAESGREE